MLVQLQVDLTDGFDVTGINVEENNRLVRTANQIYECEGYFCDGQNQPTTMNLLNQGETVRVCVKPNSDAIADGIYMRDVPEFTFVRDGTITQKAIVNSQEAPNGLTTLDCQRGYQICSFNTILFANFFTSPGRVDGYGICNMQFGGGDINNGTDIIIDDGTSELPFDPEPFPGIINDNNCDSLGGTVTTQEKQITLESISIYAGKDATVLSTTAFYGTGSGDDIELTVKIVDRELLTSGYMPQLVLFFAPPTTTIEDISTTDNGFQYYFEPSVVAWMKAKIYCCMDYTWFYVKTRNDLEDDMTLGQANTPSKMEYGSLRLKRSNGYITAYYSLDNNGGDDGNPENWVQISDSYELPDEFKTGPLKVGYRVFREWKRSYSFVTEPSLVAGDEVSISAPSLNPSYFSDANTVTSPNTVNFADEYVHFASSSSESGVMLSTETFADDVSLTVKIIDREAFGTAYQAAVYLFFVPAGTELGDIAVNDQTFDTFEDNAIATFGDKLHPSICHVWTYTNSLTPHGLIRQFGGDNFGKNLEGYLRLERREGVISSYLSTNGMGWKEESTKEILPEAYRNIPIKVGIQIRKHWNPEYSIKVLPTLETGVLPPVTSYGESPFLHTTHIPLSNPTASTVQDATYSAAMAIDQDSTTFWSSSSDGQDQWIQADMGSKYVATSITVDWTGEYAKLFVIEVSEDGVTWVNVHSHETNDNPPVVENHFIDHFDIYEPAVGRYIRIVCNEPGEVGQLNYGIWGFHVHGYETIPISLTGASASFSASANPSSYGFDKDHSTRWSSEGDGSQTQWIQADMGAQYVVTFVSIDWHDAYAEKYEVQVSSDGTIWSTIYSGDIDEPSHVDSHYANKFPIHPPWQQQPAVGRFVRLRMTRYGSGGYGYYSLWEMHVHGYPDGLTSRRLMTSSSANDFDSDNVSTIVGGYGAGGDDIPIEFHPKSPLSSVHCQGEQQRQQNPRLQPRPNKRKVQQQTTTNDGEADTVSAEFEMEFEAMPFTYFMTSGATAHGVQWWSLPFHFVAAGLVLTTILLAFRF